MRAYLQEDYEEMKSWYVKRKLPFPTKLPKIGFIEPGVAVSFLFRMEGDLGWSEGTITNPEASKELRAKAIRDIFDAIEGAAREAGIKKIISSTRLPAIVDYAREKGCLIRENSTTIIKDLR